MRSLTFSLVESTLRWWTDSLMGEVKRAVLRLFEFEKQFLGYVLAPLGIWRVRVFRRKRKLRRSLIQLKAIDRDYCKRKAAISVEKYVFEYREMPKF